MKLSVITLKSFQDVLMSCSKFLQLNSCIGPLCILLSLNMFNAYVRCLDIYNKPSKYIKYT